MSNKFVRSAVMFAVVAVIVLISSIAASAEVKPKYQFMWGRNYYYHNMMISYLVPVDNGYMRVQSGNIYQEELDYDHGDLVGIEYYDNDLNRIGKTYKIIEPELPYFGGFCAHGDHYYIVSGQVNKKESDDTEVIRVTKYDKDWNRISSASLYGEDTSSPFSWGSIDFAWSGDYMIVHTCHEMYKGADGINHQSNFSFYLDVNKMDKAHKISFDYASHSFSQLIRTENGKVVTADLGDAYPRGIQLGIYADDDPSGFTGSGRLESSIMMMRFAERDYYQETGATLSGLEISDTSYIVAGSSVDQSDSSSDSYNIYVSAIDKKSDDDEDVVLRWITDYPNGNVGSPHLVKISGDRFLLMWNEGFIYGKNAEKKEKLKCVYLNSEGEPVSEIYDLTGILSDCNPFIKNGEIMWYSYSAQKILFYKMPVSDPSQLKCVKRTWKLPPDIEFDISKFTLKASKLKKCNYTVWCFDFYCRCPMKNVKVTAKGMNKKSRKALKYIKKTDGIRVKKGTKKGTYKMKFTVKAKETEKYLSEKKSAVVTIKVK